MFDRVLIANRGEIAVRVARTLRRLGIESVAVYAPTDRGAPHVRAADRAVALRAEGAGSPYLDVAQVIEAAWRTGARAVHPGYGFLSESADAARAIEAAGLTWIGPPPEAIALLGDKAASKRTAAGAGVPVVPGLDGREDVDAAQVEAFAARAGWPVLLKASAGGGGKGMRRVDAPDEIADALAGARREALAAFGRGELLVERLVEPARHVEVQVALDAHGGAYALGERECSLQRRHQKLVEETPSPALDETQRAALCDAAVALAAAAGYRNLGTVEFLVDFADPSRFFFLEMNARLQVEHPVTELVTGLDLVELQLRIAAGERLDGAQLSRRDGHAVEARICAERPAAGFLPATGTIVRYVEPDGVRVDSGVAEGTHVTAAFDPMLLKVIAHAPDRATALERLDRALGDLVLLGVETNRDHLRMLLRHPDVRRGATTTTLAEAIPYEGVPGEALRHAATAAGAALVGELTQPAGAGAFDRPDGWRVGGEPAWGRWTVLDDGGTAHVIAARPAAHGLEVRLDGDAPAHVDVETGPGGELDLTADGEERERWWVARHGDELWAASRLATVAWRTPRDAGAGEGAASGRLEAPLPGVVIAVNVDAGAEVAAGQTLVVIESMKMELQVGAPADGVVADVLVAVGDHVRRGQRLATLDGEVHR